MPAPASEIGPGDEELIRVASLARQRAYAPYSKYKVGASIRTKRNKVHSGANVENASYGLTVCAERTAAFAAVNAGDTNFDAIAIVIDDERLPTPCGACRQVLAEFSPEMRVILATTGGKRKVTTLAELLPDPFLPEKGWAGAVQAHEQREQADQRQAGEQEREADGEVDRSLPPEGGGGAAPRFGQRWRPLGGGFEG